MTSPLNLGSVGTGMASPSGLASDGRSIDALKATAARDPKAAVREAAKQFEALFMQELMKSMRQATLSSGMLDNEATKMGTDMLDTQFATKMTGLPGGLADAIAKQLERQIAGSTGMAPPKLTLGDKPLRDAAASAAPHIPTRSAAAFVEQHQQAATAVQADSGIPAAFMIGQAAHESGWGRREILKADGSTSHNLFGIKAGGSWQGPVAEVTTTEVVDGRAQKVVGRFRAYGSYEESFRDYAKLIKDNPRYSAAYDAASTDSAQAAPSVAGFANELQRAGYATDPAYADKLTRVINTALRLQRAGGAS